MEMLRWMCGKSRWDKIINYSIIEIGDVALELSVERLRTITRIK